MRVLIASPVRQKPHIFKEFLGGLDRLEKPDGCEIERLFIFHNSPELAWMVKSSDHYGLVSSDDEYVTGEDTHHWQWENIYRIIRIKNKIIDFAIARNYDYLFFVDSDLVLHPKTLTTLLEAKKDICAEVFWTQWTPQDIRSPNAWDYNSYELKHANRLLEWNEPGLYQVGMTGACTLIRKGVLEKGVDFTMIPNLTFWGEDRHFCIRAAVHGFEIWLDTHYPATHLYRESEYQKYLITK